MRDFVGIDLSHESVLDATTLLQFRRLLLANDLTKALFDEISAYLVKQGLLMRAGIIMDATIIAMPSSTKNAGNGRDQEMYQTKKGNAWHFGMKAHIGVDASSGRLIDDLQDQPREQVLAMVKEAMRLGADPRQLDRDREDVLSPLVGAMLCMDAALLRFLLQAGADPNALQEMGRPVSL